MKQIDLRGKIAVVTGASGELGRVMVRELASCGADVAINYYSNEKKATDLASEIESVHGVRALTVRADVTSLDSIMDMKDEITKNLGKADIVVNNAVIQYNCMHILDQDPKDYQSQFESCAMHGVYMAKAFIPDMIEKKCGRFIGINTECTMQLFPYQSAYIAGKRAMNGIYKVLAKEVAEHNITVNEIAPGWILSERFADSDGSERNIGQDFPYIERVPMKRRGTDIEVANLVCFLASDLASFTTGAYIPVCGGNVMQDL